MSHLQSLTDLLSLAQLSPDALEKVLEHDRWKTEAILEHEFKIEELRQQYLHGSMSSESGSYSQDDLSFNLVSSYSECNESQVFKVAKTKVKLGILKLCEEKYPIIEGFLLQDQRYSKIPLKDREVGVMKPLANAMIYMSCCSERLKRWPIAKDKSSILHIQKDLETKALKIESLTFLVVYDAVFSSWKYLFEGELEFNDTDIKPILEKVSLRVSLKEEVEKRSDIKTSPLFKSILGVFPYIDLIRLEQYYYSLSERFVDAAIKTLTLHFTQNRPAELDSTDQYAEWSDIYISYLPEYKVKWKNQLKELELDNWNEQIAWHKALTSLPTMSP